MPPVSGPDDPYAKTQMKAVPEKPSGKPKGEVAERTEMKPSPFAEEEASDPNSGEWHAPPGKMSRETPSAKGQYSTGTDYPAGTRSSVAKPWPKEEEPEASEPGEEYDSEPGSESGSYSGSDAGSDPGSDPGSDGAIPSGDDADYSTGSHYEAEPSEASDPHGSALGTEAAPHPGGTVDLEGGSSPGADDDPYGENDYPAEDQEDDEDGGEPDGPRVGRPSETRIAPLDDLEPPSEGEDDDNATRAGPPIKLKIVAGPDAGKTKKFNGVRMVIGRTQGCELKLSDQSVSRRHLELVQGKDGVLLRDLESGNGTKVNGERVKEKLLQHDDEIAIGKTKFRYVDEVAAFKKLRDDAEKKEQEEEQEKDEPAESQADEKSQPSASKSGDEPNVVVDPGAAVASRDEVDEDDPSLRAKTNAGLPAVRPPVRPVRNAARKGSPWQQLDPKKRLLLLGGAAAVLLLLVIVVFVATRKPSRPPEDPRKAPAAEQMQLARTAIRDERYQDAVKFITEAEKILPGVDSEHLLDRATKEMSAQKDVEEVRSLLAQDRFEDARTKLATLSTATVKREDEKNKLEAELAAKELGYRLKKASELLDNRDLEAARQLIDGLPPEQQGELQARYESIEAEIKAEQKAEAQKGVQRAVAIKRARDAARELEIHQAFAAVARKFHGGEYLRAAGECDRVVDEHPGDLDIRARAKKLQSLIPNFGRNFEEGHKKYKAGQLANSVKPLRRARELYKQIGFEGALGQQIDEELAAAALAAGRDAFAHGDLGGAALNFRDAARLDPTDSRAREGLDQVGARAEDLFTEAYMVRDRDPREAIAKFRLVMEVTQPSSTTYQRAKSQLSALQPDKE